MLATLVGLSMLLAVVGGLATLAACLMARRLRSRHAHRHPQQAAIRERTRQARRLAADWPLLAQTLGLGYRDQWTRQHRFPQPSSPPTPGRHRHRGRHRRGRPGRLPARRQLPGRHLGLRQRPGRTAGTGPAVGDGDHDQDAQLRPPLRWLGGYICQLAPLVAFGRSLAARTM